MEKIAGLKFDSIKLKRSDRVLPLSSINSSIKVYDSKVSIDPLLLFQRICLNKKFADHLPEYLKYELTPYPTALFDNAGIRKTVKSKLYDLFEPISTELGNDLIYVVDGGSYYIESCDKRMILSLKFAKDILNTCKSISAQTLLLCLTAIPTIAEI